MFFFFRGYTGCLAELFDGRFGGLRSSVVAEKYLGLVWGSSFHYLFLVFSFILVFSFFFIIVIPVWRHKELIWAYLPKWSTYFTVFSMFFNFCRRYWWSRGWCWCCIHWLARWGAWLVVMPAASSSFVRLASQFHCVPRAKGLTLIVLGCESFALFGLVRVIRLHFLAAT